MKGSGHRQFVAAACAMVLSMTADAAAQARDPGDRWKPQAQIAAFKTFMPRYVRQTLGTAASDIDLKSDSFEILAMDDLNEDSLLDFITFHQSAGFCGSGGCLMAVFLASGHGDYKEVLVLSGSSMPRVRATKTKGLKDIVAYYFSVNHTPVWSVYRWNGQRYDLAYYQFCAGIHLEYCDVSSSQIIEPLPDVGLEVKDKARLYAAPDTSAGPVSYDVVLNGIVGKIREKDWYLVHLWKGTAAFVPASSVTRARR